MIGPRINDVDREDVSARQRDLYGALRASYDYLSLDAKQMLNRLAGMCSDQMPVMAISEAGLPMISYAPSEAYSWNNKRRKRIKLSKYVCKHMGGSPEIGGEIQSTVCGIMSVNCDDFEFLSGREVTDAYIWDVGSASCMTGEDNEDLIKLYEINPDRVGMLVHQSGAGRKSRALIWLTDQGHLVVDRPYPETEAGKLVYRSWAGLNGAFFRPNGEGPAFTVTLNLPDSRMLPYMDTFDTARTVNGNQIMVSNCHKALPKPQSTYDHYLRLTCTEGGPINARGSYVCDNCQERGGPDEMTSIGDDCVCESCYEEHGAYCESCEETYYINDCHVINDEVVCDYCRDRDYTECDECGEYAPNDDVINSQGSGEYCSHDCAFNAGNIICENCDELAPAIDGDGLDDSYCSEGCAIEDGNTINKEGVWNEEEQEKEETTGQSVNIKWDYPLLPVVAAGNNEGNGLYSPRSQWGLSRVQEIAGS